MTEHDRMKDLLPLSASGDIDPADLRGLRAHIAECETCRRMSDDFDSLATGLRNLPTPQPGSEVVARLRALAESRLVRNQGWRTEGTLIAALVACSWAIAVLTWPLMRSASGWMLNLWRLPGDGFYTVLTAYSILGLGLASVAAFAVARGAGMNGRTR